MQQNQRVVRPATKPEQQLPTNIQTDLSPEEVIEWDHQMILKLDKRVTALEQQRVKSAQHNDPIEKEHLPGNKIAVSKKNRMIVVGVIIFLIIAYYLYEILINGKTLIF